MPPVICQVDVSPGSAWRAVWRNESPPLILDEPGKTRDEAIVMLAARMATLTTKLLVGRMDLADAGGPELQSEAPVLAREHITLLQKQLPKLCDQAELLVTVLLKQFESAPMPPGLWATAKTTGQLISQLRQVF